MRWKIGDFEYDSDKRVIHPSSNGSLGEFDAKLLDELIERYSIKSKKPSKVINNELVKAVWGADGKDTSLQASIMKLRNAFGEERHSYIYPRPFRLTEKPIVIEDDSPAAGRGIPSNFANRDQPDEPVTSPLIGLQSGPTVSATNVRNTNGFVISLDSMIINAVWELLTNDGALDEIIGRCHRTYRRCLGDFAFAIVYSSKIATGRHFRQGHNEGNDKRVEFLQQLGDVWTHQILDEEVRSGALLKNEPSRRQIKRDLEGLSRCIEGEGWPFREWMIYDAYRHLGQDESLFEDKLSPDQYVYNVLNSPFYHDTALEKTLGGFATGRLTEFLRSGISDRNNLYSEDALRNYVRLSVLTNITVMREYDAGCISQGIYRLPHVVRSSILRETTYDPVTQQQRVLRNLVVQHALYTAFQSVDTFDRQSIVTVLLNLRNEKPFKKMRSILEHDHLVIFHPSHSKERAAEQLIREIWHCADPDQGLKEDRDLDRYRILKEVGESLPRLYDLELYRVFPELKPASSRANSS